mmetsp:Transcript_32083/g.48396  ORF Transcript_32083/g.48396 Transcript_32083/m.48396 type:complete len:149 (-) Transcript_32083:97-543(-)
MRRRPHALMRQHAKIEAGDAKMDGVSPPSWCLHPACSGSHRRTLPAAMLRPYSLSLYWLRPAAQGSPAHLRHEALRFLTTSSPVLPHSPTLPQPPRLASQKSSSENTTHFQDAWEQIVSLLAAPPPYREQRPLTRRRSRGPTPAQHCG